MNHSTKASGGRSASATVEGFTEIRPKNSDYALGLAVKFLMTEPVFASQLFGDFARDLWASIEQGYYLFVGKDNRLQGVLCWAHSDQERAEAWANGRDETFLGDSSSKDCMIIFVVQSRIKGADRFMRKSLRKYHLPNTVKYYGKRIYPDGRSRPVEIRLRKKMDL